MKQQIGYASFIVNFICIFLLVGTVIYFNAIWESLPDQIPARFDFHGNVIRYNNKEMLLIMPFFSWLFFLILSFAEWLPGIINKNKLTESKNTKGVNLILILKLIVVIVFLFVSANQIAIDLPRWFANLILFTLFVLGKVFIYSLIKR